MRVLNAGQLQIQNYRYIAATFFESFSDSLGFGFNVAAVTIKPQPFPINLKVF